MALLRFIYVFLLAFFLAQPDCEAAYSSKKQLHLSKANSTFSKEKILTDRHNIKRELERRDITAKHTDARDRQAGSAIPAGICFYSSSLAGYSAPSFTTGVREAFIPLALLLIFPEHSFW